MTENYTNILERTNAIQSWLDSVYEGDDFNNIQDKKLALGALICEEMRAAVYEETGFRCSAGIAHNKVEYLFRWLEPKGMVLFELYLYF